MILGLDSPNFDSLVLCSHVRLEMSVIRRSTRPGSNEIRTMRFCSATKTLGAETTAIVVSAVAPTKSSFASKFAVSSEYYISVGYKSAGSCTTRLDEAIHSPYPKLRLVPVLRERIHRQRLSVPMLLLSVVLKLGELLCMCIAVLVKLLQGRQS